MWSITPALSSLSRPAADDVQHRLLARVEPCAGKPERRPRAVGRDREARRRSATVAGTSSVRIVKWFIPVVAMLASLAESGRAPRMPRTPILLHRLADERAEQRRRIGRVRIVVRDTCRRRRSRRGRARRSGRAARRARPATRPFARRHGASVRRGDARDDRAAGSSTFGARVRRRMAVEREVLPDELRGVDRRHDVVGAAVDDQQRHGKRFRVARLRAPRARSARRRYRRRSSARRAPRAATTPRRTRRPSARTRRRSPRASARRARRRARRPTDMPATNTRRRSIRYLRRTARTCASTIAASPRPAVVARSNQFQQPHAFARGFWRGRSTRQPMSSASAAMRVAVAISSAVCRQPWISTRSGTRRQRAWPRGT